MQELERGQRSLQDEWVALIEQQQTLGDREQRLQFVITMRTTTQLSNKLNRLLLNAKRTSWRSWIFHIQRRSCKRFKLHAAFKCRRRCVLRFAFAQWRMLRKPVESNHDVLSHYMRIDSFNKFQGMQQEGADREAQLLEKLRELRALYSTSVQRERHLQNDLAQAISTCQQETQKAEKLEHTLNLQSAYIVQYERDNHQLQEQCDALLANKIELQNEHTLQLQSYSKLIQEKDHLIAEAQQDAHKYRHQLQQDQEKFDRTQQELQKLVENMTLQLKEHPEEVKAIKLELAASEERRLQYIRTEVMGRVIKRLGNMAMARAFETWAGRIRKAKESLLVTSLEEMQSGMALKHTLLEQQQHQQQSLMLQHHGMQQDVESMLFKMQEEVEALKLEHAASKERRLQYIRTEVMGRVIKRLGNMAMARAFGAWANRARDDREELLVTSFVTWAERMRKSKEKRLIEATDQLRANRADMLEMISLLEKSLQAKTDELLLLQQLLLDSQSRAERMDEVLKQSALEYEQRLQQSAEEMESLKLELAAQMQKAASQDFEATERLLQLRVESERVIAAALSIQKQSSEPKQPDERNLQVAWQNQSFQQQHSHTDVPTPSHKRSLVAILTDYYDDCHSSPGSCSDGSASPCSTILRTNEQLPLPHSARLSRRQQPWNSSQTSQFSSGNGAHRVCSNCSVQVAASYTVTGLFSIRR